jgi:hypothetical protein
MRKVRLIEQSSGNTARAQHVIGVDESGDVIGSDGPFALATVRCPRENGEKLAESLVENDLAPWKGKSKTVAANTSREERNRLVEGLIESLASKRIPWQVAAGYSGESIHCKAAAVCALAKKTITADDSYRGSSILIADGAISMYGDHQEHLRSQAAKYFDGAFQSSFGSIHISGMPKADLTYPEVAAADYLAGYVTDAMRNGLSVADLPEEVSWYDSNWREPKGSPLPFYRISGVNGDYGSIQKTRVMAWIKGRHPDGDTHDISSQWESSVGILNSPLLQRYLLEDVRL